MNKYNVDEIHLKLEKVEPFKHDEIGGMVISWRSDIGFGQYTFVSKPAPWNKNIRLWWAESETMDKDEDKDFGRKLLELWMNQVIIME